MKTATNSFLAGAIPANYSNYLDELEEAESKKIDYSRPLNEYPTAEKIAKFLMTRNAPARHIYTKDLNIGKGQAVQDAMEKYLATPALQSLHLKKALVSPLHLAFSMSDDVKEMNKRKEAKGYFELGTYIHQCFLEPTKFSRVIVETKGSLASNDGVLSLIKFWEGVINARGFGVSPDGEEIPAEEAIQEALNEVSSHGLNTDKIDGKKCYYYALKNIAGMESVTQDHYDIIQILKKQYDGYGGGILKEILKHSKREISFYTQEDGVDVKVRPDAIQFAENIGVNAIISIKSTASEDLKSFYNQAARMHYDLSEGMYQDIVSKVSGRDFNTTIMIMFQTVEPFGVAVLVWSADDIEMGKYKYRTGLQIAKECQEKEIWPGYETFAEEGSFGLIQMQLPTWNNREILPTNL